MMSCRSTADYASLVAVVLTACSLGSSRHGKITAHLLRFTVSSLITYGACFTFRSLYCVLTLLYRSVYSFSQFLTIIILPLKSHDFNSPQKSREKS